MNATPLEKVLAAVGEYTKSGKSFKARCPAHEDRSPSLSIGAAEDGTVLLKCHAGCSAEAVVKALGLDMRDLFPSAEDATHRKPAKSPKGKGKSFPTAAAAVAELERRLGPRSARWTYEDATREPVAVVVRWDNADGKTFRPVAKIDGNWRIGDLAGPWPLYRLPELLRSSGPVYVCEGEKAADALGALGFTVTTSANGAKAAKGTNWTPLAGRDVVILPDHDDAGAGYAEDVIRLLGQLAPKPTVKIVDLPGLPGAGDAVDFIANRHAAGLDDAAICAEIQKLAADAAAVQPKAAEPAIAPVLISLADVQPQPVSWLWPGRIALGKVTLLAGDPGLGKSFVTLDIAARTSCGAPWPDAPGIKTTAGGVVLLSAEDDAEDTIRPRLDAAGERGAHQGIAGRAANYQDDPKRESTFNLETDLPGAGSGNPGGPRLPTRHHRPHHGIFGRHGFAQERGDTRIDRALGGAGGQASRCDCLRHAFEQKRQRPGDLSQHRQHCIRSGGAGGVGGHAGQG